VIRLVSCGKKKRKKDKGHEKRIRKRRGKIDIIQTAPPFEPGKKGKINAERSFLPGLEKKSSGT